MPSASFTPAALEADSGGIYAPTTVVPGTAVTFAARYLDSFGANAIEDPHVSFTAGKSGRWIGTVYYDTSANQVCLRSPSTDPLVLSLPSCAAYGAATTLNGPYVGVDVGRTTKSPAVSDLYMNWAVSFTDSAATLDCAASRATTLTISTSNGLLFERSVSWSLKPAAAMAGSYAVVAKVTDATWVG